MRTCELRPDELADYIVRPARLAQGAVGSHRQANCFGMAAFPLAGAMTAAR
jgi:hypothetical protein